MDEDKTQEAREEIKVSKKGGVSKIKLIIVVIVLLAIGIGAWYVFGKKDTSLYTDTALGGNAASVIAAVNGEEILRTDFDDLIIKQKAVLGEPQNDEQRQLLQNQVLDIITSQKLLLQKANEAGLSITDDEIDSQISQIRAQFPDEQTFMDELVKQNFTEENLRDSIRRDMIIQNYISSQVDLESVTVSDEEIKAEYDLAVTKQDNLPELEELSEPIKAQLIQQKQQQLVSQFIDKLRNESDIQIFLE
jgi:hypothetical protein